jgi:protein-disulfide isomerase
VFASKTQPGHVQLSRRALLLSLSVAALGAGIGFNPISAFAQQKKGPAEVPMEELMKPSDLTELAVGPADAKVVVIEFASMTCGHCAKFHKNVWPEFKKKYVDTGKVRFIFREFPLDNLATAASMLARCAGGDKTFPLIEALFEKQEEWINA